MIIPGIFISIATFPGIIVHEIAHKFFCDIAKVEVYEICYLQISSPAGYVIHEKPNTLMKSFLISTGPLIINSILCMILTLPFVYPFYYLNAVNQNISNYLLAWIGISIGSHAIPSDEDVDCFVNAVKNADKKIVYYLFAVPFSGIIKFANVLSFFWFDLIYAVLISLIIPKFILY